MDTFKKLENPIWHSLCETHEKFAITYNNVKFYHPDICPFGAFTHFEDTQQAMLKYAELTKDFFIVGETPKKPASILFDKAVPCEQMVLEALAEPTYSHTIEKLTENHIQEIYDLVWLVMPGYYKKRTFEMGDYYGIFIDNKLVAITGERLQLNEFIEVSAVVTHPNYTRRGLAKQLVAHTCKKILDKGKIPILHVADKNVSAIKLYEKLGFKSIRKMVWRHYLVK
ncbi:GNAT family N-acetyltransferase [Tenacibaculum sp. 190524A02b]|uniref:GNAT family N-acetyltransferase n=1 Tax=Tenacibaculum vairaonense TaxID=3137860 RepID=UPI0031FA98AB